MRRPNLLLPLALLALVSSCSKKDDAPPAPKLSEPGAPGLGAAVVKAVASLDGFEGEVGLMIKSAKESKVIPPFVLQVKGTKLRFDPPTGVGALPGTDGPMHVVVDASQKKLWGVADAQKRVMVMDMDKFAERMKSSPFAAATPPGTSAAPTKAPPKLTKTGKSDTVAGHTCENWDIVPESGERAEICVANEGVAWFQMPTLGLPEEHVWARELLDGHHLPLRVVSYDAAGAEQNRIEVTKLEKKPIPDAAFDIPADYAVIDLAQMLSQMGGMGGMGPGQKSPMGGPPGQPGAMPPGMRGLPPGVLTPEVMKKIQEAQAAAAARRH